MVRHFIKGDSKSAIGEQTSNSPVLYQCKYCPFSQRVQLVLKYHGVQHNRVYLNVFNKPEWMQEVVHPNGKVPVLAIGNERISDSLEICREVDSKFGGSCKLCNDASKEAEAAISKWFGQFFKPLHDLMGDVSCKEATWPLVLAALQEFQTQLQPRPFVCGEELGLGDILLYPPALICLALAELDSVQLPLPFTSWVGAVQAHEVVAEDPDSLINTKDCWKRFLVTLREGKANFDL